LKLKRFKDSEARIIGMSEMMHNDNPQEPDNFGNSKRAKDSSCMYPANTMGRLVVTDIHHPEWPAFELGTGFTHQQRADIWRQRHMIVDKHLIVKYKYQKSGMKLVPRCPVFLGFRNTTQDL